MADSTRLQRVKNRPIETYSKIWLGFLAIAVIAALIAAMLLVKALGLGYKNYTAEFHQAAAMRAGNPIMVAGIPVGNVTSMKLAGDHVEARLKVRDDVVLGKDTKARIQVATILGSRYLELQPEGAGRLPDKTIDLAHTEVPYDLQSLLQDSATTFEQVNFDQVAQSLAILGKQLDGLPAVVPQAMQNIQTLSSIIAERRDQLGTLLKSTEQISNTLHRQQAGIGSLINQSQDLFGEFVARRTVFHAMLQALTELIHTLDKTVVVNRPQLEETLKNVRDLSEMIGKHDDLLRSTLQVAPVVVRNWANAMGSGNAVEFSGLGGLAVDSWMCAISGRAKQFGLIQYFKDCK